MLYPSTYKKGVTMLLAGDIGGTKTRLAIYDSESTLRHPLVERTFPSGDYDSLEAVIEAFLKGSAYPIDRASFGVAGPVVAGRARITNLPWVIEEGRIKQAFGLESAALLNDLEAIANAVPVLEADDLHVLNEGEPEEHGSIGVIAPGTGLGEGYLTWNGSRYVAFPSEGGHTDFAPLDDLQIDLLRYMMAREPHVSYELVCAGKGLPHLYSFLKDSGRYKEPDWLKQALADAADPNPVIVEAAFSGKRDCPLCEATLELFVSIMGAEAGNLALKVLATGGIYVAGGIPPRILPVLADGRFMTAFRNKGRLSAILAPIPVYVIENPDVALLGAASFGMGL
jgi:glucokinase